MQHDPTSYDRLEDLKPEPRKANVVAVVVLIAVAFAGIGFVGWLVVRAVG